MQTAEGAEARSIVASEMCAMVDLKVLPDLLAHYDTDPINFEQLCRDFALAIGLPASAYVYVFYPFFFSPDWDPRHAWFRQVMSSSRVPPDEMAQLCGQWAADDFPDIWPPRAAKRQCCGKAQQLHSEPAPTQEDVAAAKQQLQDALQQWSAEHEGIDYFHWRTWHAARTDKRLRVVLPEQYHPLVKVTPDLNSPVEHAVGTIKREIRDMLLSHDLHDPALWKAQLYRAFAEKAVLKRLTGVQGRHHIGGSVRKLPCILKILAADKGEPLVLEHVFGSEPGKPVPAPGPKDRYSVKGSGGEWIRDTRWT